MKRILRFFPTILTLLGLASGIFGVVFAVNDSIKWVVVFTVAGIFFDFFDGFFARLLNVESELGKQLDSLADLVTSGLVPGILMTQMLLKSSDQKALNSMEGIGDFPFIVLFGFAITLASAYRLANFNIDKNQKENFVGLPTPANALFILSLALVANDETSYFFSFILRDQYILSSVSVLSCLMLNVKIELFSLKFKKFNWEDNKEKYIFLVLSLGLIFIWKLFSVSAIVVLYILLSIFLKKRRG